MFGGGGVRAALGTLGCVIGLACGAGPSEAWAKRLTALEQESDPTASSMAALAATAMATYHGPDRMTHLDNLFRLQILAGQDEAAIGSIQELRDGRGQSSQAIADNVQYEIFARTRLHQARHGGSFESSFRGAFREVMAPLDDRTSALAIRTMSASLYPVGISLHVDLEGGLRQAQSAYSASPNEASALNLLRAYQIASVYRVITPLLPDLIAQDDRRRYVFWTGRAPGADGSSVCALIVRPRSAARLPALLEFTIYADPEVLLSEARRSASNGYVGVEGMTRGKGCAEGPVVPYEHDGADAAALITWISRQPWSDGRVGMFGASYNGFTQWAAAKHMPVALKAMMTSVTNSPGIDAPMEMGVFQSFMYPWPFYTATTPYLDAETYGDQARWARLNREWYVSGRAYRGLESIDGHPNPVFAKWLDHPTFDGYWKAMAAYGEDLARVDVPVLATTGYYDGGQFGVLHFLEEHYRQRPDAQHYLIIGPYNHSTGNRGTVDVLGEHRSDIDGLPLDHSAQIDIGELRYAWFDHVFKGGPKPAILADKINYQVMGADRWDHATSIAAMTERFLRLHFTGNPSALGYRMSEAPAPARNLPKLVVNLADRSDVDRPPDDALVSRELDLRNGLAFVGEPVRAPTVLSGRFSGKLIVRTNKKDFDFQVRLYELTPAGDYVALTSQLARASHLRDVTRRRLLKPGKPQELVLRSRGLIGRRLSAGSRLVVTASVVKRPDMQINYGTGRDVSDETIADAGEPLVIEWLVGSYIDVPIGR